MKQSKIRNYTFALLLMSAFGMASAHASSFDTEHVTVTGNHWTNDDVAHAKHKIAMIQSDPGYYYSGAAGAVHRIHDVKAYQAVVDGGERLPASTK